VRVIVAAPAKVNLWLRVGPPRETGFHDLDTLFCGLDLADTITVFADGGSDTTLEVRHAEPLLTTPDLGPPDRNLAVRAARAFSERAGLSSRPRIDLVKRIPAGAGLGGGSSDAAAVLRALNRLHPRAVQPDALMELAVELGSDVPFFAASRPLARGAGRGEKLRVLPALPSRPVVLLLPDLAISTADAYRWVDVERAGRAVADVPAEPGDDAPSWDAVADRAANDFEPAVFGRYPVLEEMKSALETHGAAPAMLAGSGSSLFGVFEDPDAADAAVGAVRDRWPGLRMVRTATRVR
jgi:4-diphosphocytidyl-2-C-methyl-D-erythritol kinase